MKYLLEFLYNPNNQSFVSVLIAALSVAIAATSLIVSIVSSRRNRNQYIGSIQPELSMKLIEYNGMLYLQIKNTGKLAAKSIRIEIKSIENNGSLNELMTGPLFNRTFELYPEETVQDVVAIFGSSLATSAFPKILLGVSYCVGTQKKCHKYERSVTFISAYLDKICADVNFDVSTLDAALQSISRSSVRVANYMDGHQLTSVDTINLLAGTSLKTDLERAMKLKHTSIQGCSSTQKEPLSESKTKGGENSNADT